MFTFIDTIYFQKWCKMLPSMLFQDSLSLACWLAFFFLHPHASQVTLSSHWVECTLLLCLIIYIYIYKLCMWFFSLPVVFCFFYAVHGILREREFELYAYIAGIVVLLSYICIDLIVNKDRRYKLKWVSMTQFWFIYANDPCSN